jgi:hypothetical protein
MTADLPLIWDVSNPSSQLTGPLLLYISILVESCSRLLSLLSFSLAWFWAVLSNIYEVSRSGSRPRRSKLKGWPNTVKVESESESPRAGGQTRYSIRLRSTFDWTRALQTEATSLPIGSAQEYPRFGELKLRAQGGDNPVLTNSRQRRGASRSQNTVDAEDSHSSSWYIHYLREKPASNTPLYSSVSLVADSPDRKMLADWGWSGSVERRAAMECDWAGPVPGDRSRPMDYLRTNASCSYMETFLYPV